MSSTTTSTPPVAPRYHHVCRSCLATGRTRTYLHLVVEWCCICGGPAVTNRIAVEVDAELGRDERGVPICPGQHEHWAARPGVTIRLSRCSVVVIVKGPDGSEMLLRHLVAAMGDAAELSRQLPTRLYLSPHQGTVAAFAERCSRRWLAGRGCEVEVGD